MREGAPVINGTLRVWSQIGRATGAHAIGLRVLEFAPGLSPGSRNDHCDEVLYLVQHTQPGYEKPGTEQGSDADPRIAPDHASQTPLTVFIDGWGHEIIPESGIYLRPGATLTVNNSGPDSAVFISSQCPDPSASNFVNPLTTPSSDSAPPERPPLVRLSDRPALPTADRWYRVLVDDDVGSAQVTQFIGSIPPGRAPDHFHHYEEVLFILRGQGRMWAGESNTPITPGSCIYLPKGQIHCVENTGQGELRLLGVFYPAGSPSVRYDV
jgi:mannose-6-phosphate isomerase-like protein (cupin superfamily)